MTTEAKLEALISAMDAMGHAQRRVASGDCTSEAVKAEIRAINVLLDACIDAGMSHDVTDHVAWAHVRVTQYLTRGPTTVKDRSIDPETGTYWAADRPEYWDVAADAWRDRQTFSPEQAARRDREIAVCETRAAQLRAA